MVILFVGLPGCSEASYYEIPQVLEQVAPVNDAGLIPLFEVFQSPGEYLVDGSEHFPYERRQIALDYVYEILTLLHLKNLDQIVSPLEKLLFLSVGRVAHIALLEGWQVISEAKYVRSHLPFSVFHLVRNSHKQLGVKLLNNHRELHVTFDHVMDQQVAVVELLLAFRVR